MKRSLLLLLVFFVMGAKVFSQETFPRNDVKDKRTGAFAFTNATIFLDYKTRVDNATLLVRDGKVERSGAGISVPAGYTTVDLKGKYIYPSMIDIYSNYGLPKVERSSRSRFGDRKEQINSKTSGAYNANEAIKSEYDAFKEFKPTEKTAKGLRKEGFGTVLTFRADGIARGTSSMVTLGDDTPNQVMLNSSAAAHYSLNKGTSTQMYPVSIMGSMALLRQTFLDAEWYASMREKPFIDKSLDAWIQNQRLPQIFEATNWKAFLRADKVGDEFGVQYIIKGSGDEYKMISQIKAANASVILPVNYPAAYDVDDPFDAINVSLADMKHWELTPANPSVLEQNDINFSFTASGLKKSSDFLPNVRKAIKYGLSEEGALKALTYNPANMLRMGNSLGNLNSGAIANFIITSGSLFEEKVIIYENWIQGRGYKINDLDLIDHSGKYTLAVAGTSYNLEVSGEPGKHSMKIKINDTTDVKVDSKITAKLITLGFEPKKEAGQIRLSGWFIGVDVKASGTTGSDGGSNGGSNGDGEHAAATSLGWKGQGQMANGDWIDWTATYTGTIEKKEKKKKDSKTDDVADLGKVIFPFVAHGSVTRPQQETLLIKNATVWTNEAEGIIQNTDVLIQNGKIARIGQNLSASGARVIDGTGKHLTPGIIDEHSHLAGDGINDVAVNSGMVRIGDVINSEHIGVYRALAGGVTAAQILHGSANPIGGQSALLKFRWGVSPEEMKIKGADGFIKFALGENVKRSRSNNSIRFPRTRMGVEQVYMDVFTAARDYEKEWKAYNSLSSKAKAGAQKPRKDLAMETMVEILNSKRFISCHSYVQSEINMLMKVAEKFDFRINTFTHILEGYKVADKMAKHGAGAGTFADWWAYKWEVRYAIPYGPALMNNEGVVTAVNSDSGEMIRRLNQEAAKSIKYGGLSEEDAFKLITLNPAKLLHLDNRMGSIKVGKDGDVVLWTDNPLSIYARAQETIIDGTVYYSMDRDLEIREYIKSERARLIQKMKGEKKAKKPIQKATPRVEMDFDCEGIFGIEEYYQGDH